MKKEKQNRLKDLLLKYSHEAREVTLASGRKSHFYFDGKQTSLHPEGLNLIAEGMFELIQDNFPECQAIGGPTLGADPLVASVAMLSWQRREPLSGFIVRKTPKGHGTRQWIEGAKHLRLGMRVVLLEDVITTGGSLLTACEKVREAGFVVKGVVVLVDREEGGRENLEAANLQVVSMFKKSELISA